MSENLNRIDEPRGFAEYAAVLTHVAIEGTPVIVRRDGKDLAAVVPLEHLDRNRENVADEKAAKDIAKPAIKTHSRLGFRVVECAADAPARRMTVPELLALEEACSLREDHERLGVSP